MKTNSAKPNNVRPQPGVSVASPQQSVGAAGPVILAQRTLIVVGVVVAVMLMLLLVWYAADLLLLVFVGVLLSILLRHLSRPLRTYGGFGYGMALAVVTLVLLLVIALVTWFVAERVITQLDELSQQLPVALDNLNGRLDRYPWGRQILNGLSDVGETIQARSGLLQRVTGFASATLNLLLNLIVVIAIGIYLAAQPRLYAGGIRRLLPFRYRPRAGEVLAVLDDALGRWLLGRFTLMVVNGSITALGLWLLGVPLMLTLGLIAGLLNFIPNFGPFIAAAPAILITLVESPSLAFYTALLYFVVQMLDGYVFTPLVDRRSVTLPPVLTIMAQLLLGLLFGFVGLLVASPLTAVVLILVKMLYVEDLLGDPIMQEGSLGDQDQQAHEQDP